jgi:hypothetical protein
LAAATIRAGKPAARLKIIKISGTEIGGFQRKTGSSGSFLVIFVPIKT